MKRRREALVILSMCLVVVSMLCISVSAGRRDKKAVPSVPVGVCEEHGVTDKMVQMKGYPVYCGVCFMEKVISPKCKVLKAVK